MGNHKKQEIMELLKSKNYKQLYQTQSQVINEMLLIKSQEEFEDFLKENNSLDERAFWLYYYAVHGESLLIGGYSEDVTEEVTSYLAKNLPTEIFNTIKADIQQIYVDLDAKNNLEEQIGILNKKLEQKGHLIRLDYDETYCAGAYFLSVGCLEI